MRPAPAALALVSHPRFITVSASRATVSAGPAGLLCAETLRQEGFTDRIVMCTMDRHPPYDRPKLSKVRTHRPEAKRCQMTPCRTKRTFGSFALTCRHQSLESTAQQLQLRSADFLRDRDIELVTEKEVSLSFPAPTWKQMKTKNSPRYGAALTSPSRKVSPNAKPERELKGLKL